MADLCECRWCGESYSPQGIKSHESYCDDNPRQGVPFDFQEDAGLLDGDNDNDEDETGAAPDAPDPFQEADASGGLPYR